MALHALAKSLARILSSSLGVALELTRLRGQFRSLALADPLQVPEEYQKKFSFISDLDNRRVYHAMVNFLDDNLKNFTDTMKELGMWDNTLMVLSSDVSSRKFVLC